MAGTEQRVALGFRAHSGWAAAVALAESRGKLIVLDRRRIVTADPAIPGSRQPYHAAERLEFPEAEPLIRSCRESSVALASNAVAAFVGGLTRNDYRVNCAGILFASGRQLPDLAGILRSHALIHTAEGDFFREVLVQACESSALPVTRVKEREVRERAAATVRLSAAELQALIGELGRTLGPPWRVDEKLASLAAWIALRERNFKGNAGESRPKAFG
jgi:hypothetical protein